MLHTTPKVWNGRRHIFSCTYAPLNKPTALGSYFTSGSARHAGMLAADLQGTCVLLVS